MELIREVNDDYTINSINDTLKYLSEFKKEDKEFFIVLGLDTGNKVLYRDIVSIGILNECLVHPREVFKTAILRSVNSIIIAHNHPSGSIKPSKEDIDIYERLSKAGDILGIKIIDSLIITPNDLTSYKYEVK